MIQAFRTYRSNAMLALAFMVLSGCGKHAEIVETQCVVNPDQVSTFTGHWTSHPIPVAIESGDFTNSEQQAIANAVGTWNDFFNSSKGFDIINDGKVSGLIQVQSTSGSRTSSETICSHPIVTPSGFNKKVMIYKVTKNWTHGTSAIAVTSTCPVTTNNGGQYKEIMAAVMEINYEDYFSAGKAKPDLQSIVTHELGHLAGLGHSCGKLNNGRQVACAADYQQAMMYPTLGFVGSYGQIKRDLQTNDQQRANCLY